MESSFPREAPALHFAPRSHVEANARARRQLLWPAWAYRVVAPEARQRRLNVLQKAVLGLCRAGFKSAEAIGEKLDLHRDLALFIVLELREAGLLEESGLPTEEGVEVLVEETLDTGRPAAGYVFQDPFLGELWPRFVEQLEYAVVERREGGPPMLVLGTTGSPRPIPLHIELPEGAPPPPPDAREILRATRRHRAALRRGRSASHWDDEEAAEEPVRAVLMSRVSMIELTPRPVLLSTYLYLPANPEDGVEWHVCDPFGLGASPFLRRAIERRHPRSPRLYELVSRLLEQSVTAKLGEHRALIDELRQRANLALARRLPPRLCGLPVYERVLDMMQAAEETQLLGDQCPEHKLRSALVLARTALEEVFRAMAERYPLNDAWRCLFANDQPVQDEAYAAGLYEAAARAVGFSTPIPSALSNVKPAQVRWASERRDAARLRPMIVAAILGARDNAAHPLRGAAARTPGLLDEMDAIARAGGQAAHANDERVSETLLQETTERIQRVVAVLSGIDIPDVNSTSEAR